MAPAILRRLAARLRPPLLTGAEGEDLACRYLEARGFSVLARNFRCRSGEVDVVAREGSTLVFVEVKDRKGRSHGEGCESVTFGKRRRIVRAAQIYATARGCAEDPIRFDVISIERGAGEPRIRHDRGAFTVDD